MKGLLEEYGSFLMAIATAIIIVGFLLPSAMDERGELHQTVTHMLVRNGAKTDTVIDEWEIGSIKATFKDDGTLYFTGSGTLPSYGTVEETPWKDEEAYIDRVQVEDTVTVSGQIPY